MIAYDYLTAPRVMVQELAVGDRIEYAGQFDTVTGPVEVSYGLVDVPIGGGHSLLLPIDTEVRRADGKHA